MLRRPRKLWRNIKECMRKTVIGEWTWWYPTDVGTVETMATE